MYKIYLFGVPRGFEIYPDADRVTMAYYQQFYNNTITDDHRFMVRLSGSSVIYTFISYGLISGINRTGSMWGMSVIFNGKYSVKPKKILDFFQEAYSQLVKTGVLFLRENGMVKYKDSGFSGKLDYLQNIIKVLCSNVEANLKSDLTILPSLDNYSQEGIPKTILVGHDLSDAEINKKLFTNRSIALSPSIKSTEEVSTIKEFDIDKFAELSEKIQGVKQNQLLIQSELHGLQTAFSEIQLQERNTPVSIVEIKSEWVQVDLNFRKNSEVIHWLKAHLPREERDSLSAILLKDLETLSETHKRQEKIIARLEEMIRKRIPMQNQETDSVSHSLSITRSFKLQKPAWIIGSLICLGLLLYYLRPVKSELDLYKSEIEKADELYFETKNKLDLKYAKSHYEKALQVKPGDKYAMGRLEEIRLKLEPMKEDNNLSENNYDLLIKKADSNYFGIGRGKNIAKARQRYTEALKIKPEDAYARKMLLEIEAAAKAESNKMKVKEKKVPVNKHLKKPQITINE